MLTEVDVQKLGAALPTLTWQLESTEESCWQLTYTLHNPGKKAWTVLDLMTAFDQAGQLSVDPDGLIIRPDAEQGGLAVFVRGYQPSRRVLESFELIPAGRALPPGRSLSGGAKVRLPLTDRHPSDPEAPLPAPVHSARLEIGVMPGESRLETHRREHGEDLEIPQRADAVLHQKWVRGEELATPR